MIDGEFLQKFLVSNQTISYTVMTKIPMIRPFPFILIGIGIVSVGAYAAITHFQSVPDVSYPLPNDTTTTTPSLSSETSVTSVPSATSATSVTSATSSTPGSVHIAVPFQSQAPLQNWDALHEEACEEASLILVDQYLHGQTISPEEMETNIQTLVKWETDNGYAQDVTIDQLGKIATAEYGLKATVITNVTVESIKKEIAAGHPVIAPAAGQLLGNPYFSGKGPPYHVLVIIGYDSTHFITDDVGTRRGKDYKYDNETLINAIHDWNGSNETIQSGRKAMLVVTK
jgi:uncharacterized protein YvpB